MIPQLLCRVLVLHLSRQHRAEDGRCEREALRRQRQWALPIHGSSAGCDQRLSPLGSLGCWLVDSIFVAPCFQSVSKYVGLLGNKWCKGRLPTVGPMSDFKGKKTNLNGHLMLLIGSWAIFVPNRFSKITCLPYLESTVDLQDGVQNWFPLRICFFK